jgi:hypothetical protein
VLQNRLETFQFYLCLVNDAASDRVSSTSNYSTRSQLWIVSSPHRPHQLWGPSTLLSNGYGGRIPLE